MLKAPPANPRDYKGLQSQDKSERGALISSKIFLKKVYKYKKVDNGIFPIKKVDKDAVGLINLIFIFRTNLWPTSVNLIFNAPNVANLGFLKI